jgi:hypothetical protein
MPTTPWLKLFYPNPTDPVRDGAANMQAQAASVEAASPAFGGAGGQLGRAAQMGDKLRLATFWGAGVTNQFGQVAVPVSGFAGIGHVSAFPAGSQNQMQAYFVVDNVNTSLANVILYAYAQNGNAVLTNFPVDFTALVVGWGPIP